MAAAQPIVARPAMITGPQIIRSSDPPPQFQISNLGAGRYYAVEVATRAELFEVLLELLGRDVDHIRVADMEVELGQIRVIRA